MEINTRLGVLKLVCASELKSSSVGPHGITSELDLISSRAQTTGLHVKLAQGSQTVLKKACLCFGVHALVICFQRCPS